MSRAAVPPCGILLGAPDPLNVGATCPCTMAHRRGPHFPSKRHCVMQPRRLRSVLNKQKLVLSPRTRRNQAYSSVPARLPCWLASVTSYSEYVEYARDCV